MRVRWSRAGSDRAGAVIRATELTSAGVWSGRAELATAAERCSTHKRRRCRRRGAEAECPCRSSEATPDRSARVDRSGSTVEATGPNGKPRLIGVEYIVFEEAWKTVSDRPPALFGHELHYVPSPNRYGIPAFWEIHVWAWRSNPRGLFEDWNPRIGCP